VSSVGHKLLAEAKHFDLAQAACENAFFRRALGCAIGQQAASGVVTGPADGRAQRLEGDFLDCVGQGDIADVDVDVTLGVGQ
jgi:hypothetical protein